MATTSATTATAIAVTNATTFTYTGSNAAGSAASGTVAWVRTGLYNVVSSSNGAPAVYGITPVEYCRDLNLTDCVVGADGALYFSIGGRGTPASLFRVVYTGNEPAKPLTAAITGLRTLRMVSQSRVM